MDNELGKSQYESQAELGAHAAHGIPRCLKVNIQYIHCGPDFTGPEELKAQSVRRGRETAEPDRSEDLLKVLLQ